MKWNINLYCTHAYHINQCGNPEHITKKLFRIKNCGNQKKGICKWLTIRYSPPKIKTKQEKKKEFNEIAKSKTKLKNLCENQEKRIKNLNGEIVDLYKDRDYYKNRYEEIRKKLLSLGVLN